MKKLMKTLWLVLAAAGMALLLGGVTARVAPSDAQGTDPVAVKNTFDAALNAGNAEAAAAAFADTAVFTSPGGTVYMGKAQIRGFLQELVAQHYRAELVAAGPVAGTTVTSQGTISLDQFRQLGVDPVEATAEVVVQGGMITSFRVVLTPASAARVQAAQRAPLQLPRTGEGRTIPSAVVPLGLALVAAGAAIRYSRGGCPTWVA